MDRKAGWINCDSLSISKSPKAVDMDNSLEKKMNRSIKMVQKGFTLIELMIVVAIIGILAALAIPAYQDYVARSQASEALTITDGLKVAAQEYFSDKGVCPSNAPASAAEALTYGIDDDTTGATGINGSYVAQVQVGEDASAGLCVFTATYKAADVASKLQSRTLIVYGDMTAGTEVDWVCDDSIGSTDGTLPNEVRPSACKP